MPRRCRYRWGLFRAGPGAGDDSGVVDFLYLPMKPVESVSIGDCVEIYDYEIEAFALVHYEGLTTEEAATKMNLSKSTFWRILEQARFKLAKALIERKPIKVVSTRQGSKELSG